ncbi:hypothetical protein [Mesonia sp. K7]|uniref:hypothetical protein n=1 Tax=Mesonia sp. K7 TaxID=2218606 RepID=UPI000DA8F13E|nr:hypothetical protein [Mesonia sp. K7]PZD77617.1 hypothetical protein DNG35_08530 [Mesonia sp. K7]
MSKKVSRKKIIIGHTIAILLGSVVYASLMAIVEYYEHDRFKFSKLTLDFIFFSAILIGFSWINYKRRLKKENS